jgi:hypothetical protein
MPLIEGCSRVFQAERPDGRGTAAIHLAGSWPVQRRLHWHGAGMALAWRWHGAPSWQQAGCGCSYRARSRGAAAHSGCQQPVASGRTVLDVLRLLICCIHCSAMLTVILLAVIAAALSLGIGTCWFCLRRRLDLSLAVHTSWVCQLDCQCSGFFRSVTIGGGPALVSEQVRANRGPGGRCCQNWAGEIGLLSPISC